MEEYGDSGQYINLLIISPNRPMAAVIRMDLLAYFGPQGENDTGFYQTHIETAENVTEAMERLKNRSFHIVIVDHDLESKSKGVIANGLDFIGDIREIQPLAQIIYLCREDDPQYISTALKSGAAEYISKERNERTLELQKIVFGRTWNQAIEQQEMARKEKLSHNEDYGSFVCRSPVMQLLNLRLEALAETKRPVLILGATGLGKGATAQRLHEQRKRFLNDSKRIFFNINIGAMPDELAQSELFGHEAHAFTGAGNKIRQGYLELAENGDLFLDEVGDISISLQTKLLKVIEEREFQRVGGRKTLTTNASFILATNKNLEELVRQGKFREDLYARISTFKIELPTLEQRRDDLPEIIKSILKKIAKEHPDRRLHYEELPEDLIAYLCRPMIPGNIRGIQNDLYRLILYSRKLDNGRLKIDDWVAVLEVESSNIIPFEANTPHGNSGLTMEDLLNLETNIIGEDFPGLSEIKEIFEKKILEEAMRKYPKLIDRAKALKMSKSHASGKFKKVEYYKEVLKKKNAA